MNNLGASILVTLVLVVLLAPRRYALLGMVGGVLYLTQGQALNVLGFNMFAVRFLEMAGFARVVWRKELSIFRLNHLDLAFAVTYLFVTSVYLMRSSEGQAFWVGYSVDALLSYLTFRGLVGSREDFIWFLQAFVFMLIPYVALVSIESVTHRNPFDLMNADFRIPWLRGDRLRCYGSFRHPTLMGTLGACFLPLYLGLLLAGVRRMLSVLGIVLCLGLVFLANSGGPLNIAACSIMGWFLWVFRAEMKKVRMVGLLSLILLAMVMKAPIWFLPAKAAFFSGGDGWHRSYLMGCAIRNVKLWWVWGMPLADTRDWFPYILITTSAADITNQFVYLGITAGLGAIAVFAWFLHHMFRALGQQLEIMRATTVEPTLNEYMLWGLGVVLAVHIVNFFGITYFDQLYMIWYLHLAAITRFATPVAPESVAAVAAQYAVIPARHVMHHRAAAGSNTPSMQS